MITGCGRVRQPYGEEQTVVRRDFYLNVPDEPRPENPWRDRLQAAVRVQSMDPALPDRVRRSLRRHDSRQRFLARWRWLIQRAAAFITFDSRS